MSNSSDRVWVIQLANGRLLRCGTVLVFDSEKEAKTALRKSLSNAKLLRGAKPVEKELRDPSDGVGAKARG